MAVQSACKLYSGKNVYARVDGFTHHVSQHRPSPQLVNFGFGLTFTRNVLDPHKYKSQRVTTTMRAHRR